MGRHCLHAWGNSGMCVAALCLGYGFGIVVGLFNRCMHRMAGRRPTQFCRGVAQQHGIQAVIHAFVIWCTEG